MKLPRIELAVALLLMVQLSSFGDQRERPRRKDDTISGGAGSGAWTAFVIQTPGAPEVSLKRIGPEEVMVSWPTLPGDFSLLVNTNTVKPSWRAPAESVQKQGTNRFILVSPTAGVSYFRLEKR